MPPSLYDAIPGQYGDSSMDQEERATGRYLAVACHLPQSHRDSMRQWQRYKITDASTYSYRLQLDAGFRELPGHHQQMLCRRQ